VLSYQKKLFYLRSENNLININFLGFSEGKCIQKTWLASAQSDLIFQKSAITLLFSARL